MKEYELKVVDFFDCHEEEIFELLAKIVNINSHSKNLQGIRQVGDVLIPLFKELGFSIAFIENEGYGRLIIAEKELSEGPKVLLLGHLDTVFPIDSPFQKLTNTQKNGNSIATGPGIIDMKSGIVSIYYIVKAIIEMANLKKGMITVVLTGDEEIGSPESKKSYLELAKKHDLALVFEAAPKTNSIIAERKGVKQLRLKIKGKDAHPGVNPEDGINTVSELGYKIVELLKLNNKQDGISLNFGMVKGGVAVNRICSDVSLWFEYRFKTSEQDNYIFRQINEIVNNSYTQNQHLNQSPTAEIEVLAEAPPLVLTEQNKKVINHYKAVYKELGFGELNAIFFGGASDANNIGQTRIPVLDGLGPLGGNEHSREEYLLVASLCEKCKVNAVFLYRYINGIFADIYN